MADGAATVRRGSDGQLCVSNASSTIWVTHTAPSCCREVFFFTESYNLTSHIVPDIESGGPAPLCEAVQLQYIINVIE